jgi:hypothetical protein
MDATHVTFTDGRSESFDAIVLATGFRHGLEQLLAPGLLGEPPPGQAPRAHDGLYFCGFSVSPAGMLSDICAQARWIAQAVAQGRAADQSGRQRPR